MQIILNNPYRTVGLLVGATATQQNKHITRIPKFIDAGDEIPEEFTAFSFPVLGEMVLTLKNVTDAASKLNLDSDKMNVALFWFYDGKTALKTDEDAFKAIKEADLDQVINIWTKLTSNGEVSQRNASAYSNLGTLYLSGILEGKNTNEAILEKGISLKLKFLESSYYKELQHLATDEKIYNPTKKELQLLFLNQVQSEIEKSGVITSNKLLDIITKQEFSAKEDFLQGFVQKPIEQIEQKIDEAKAKRKANKADSVKIYNSLMEDTIGLIKILKSILGVSNLKYNSIADKLAIEFFACGRDYFMHYKDTSTDPSDSVMKMFKYAKSIAVGNIAKQQIDENIIDLLEWIEVKPEREKQKRIGDDLKFITSKLERVQTLSDTVTNAKDLVDSCKPRLVNVKNALGSFDDFYLKISSAVVSKAQGMLITAVNEAQEGFKKYQVGKRLSLDDSTNRLLGNLNIVSLDELTSIVNSAYDVTTSMQSMDMVANLKQSFQKNRDALYGIKNQIYRATTTPTERAGKCIGKSIGKATGGGGCYIATMAYGDYNNPQVMILRQFRDNVLNKSAFGKWFIKTYYHYSPKLVEKLKNKKGINTIIRKTLNQFIKLIKVN